jgi:hypothetical protein
MRHVARQNWFSRLGGYLAVPHELLHVAGYWLVGKRCQYQMGDFQVKPVDPMTLKERLVGVLFPFVIFSTICFISGVLSGFAYSYNLNGGSLFWFIFLTGLAVVSGSYAGTAIGDLRKAYLLILDKPWYSWTPFDIFFWPVVDWWAVRKRVTSRESHDKPN